MIPPERRLSACEALIEQSAFFVVHAPRQTGKTTAMKVLAARLTESGRYAALWFSCEEARVFADNLDAAERAIWNAIQTQARSALPESLWPPDPEDAPLGRFLGTQLSRWAASGPRPPVIIFDEIDSLSGDALLSVLSQLRAGYNARPAPFPWSVVLCGMRDVRDYKVASGGGPVRLGSSSPFNIKTASVRLGNFSQAEVAELYEQHTAETGQVFTPEALARAFELTEGQPWLVNALAREVVEEMRVPAEQSITIGDIDEAKERLIRARATHLDSLLARLHEESVRKVLEPVIAGEMPAHDPLDDDQQYVLDLGLIAPDRPVRIANPIYREIILRVLASSAEAWVLEDPRSYVAQDGTLDVPRLFEGFVEFWRQHGELLAPRMLYSEAAAQLVLMGYLHRIVNGGGSLDREIGVGRKRIDMVLRWPYPGEHGKRLVQRAAIEVKVWRDRDKKGDPLTSGLQQIDEYLGRLGLDQGILVLFDCRSAAAPIEERTRFEAAKTPSGRDVTVIRA